MGIGKIGLFQVALALLAVASSNDSPRHHHHHHHHHAHHRNNTSGVAVQQPAMQADAAQQLLPAPKAVNVTQAVVQMDIARQSTKEFTPKETAAKSVLAKGHLIINGPMPRDFSDRFAQGVADATGCRQGDVKLLGAVPVAEAQGSEVEVMFESLKDVVAAVEDQAADSDSKLANGVLHIFLVASQGTENVPAAHDVESQAEPPEAPEVDMSMPYGDLEPFGREDTAQELTESSIRESDAMVDQLERAEVAEEKRAVFRALTRLRGAAITSYDGVARSQTGNIDNYARSNQWRKAHPVRHLADEEADVSRWAFPEDADE